MLVCIGLSWLVKLVQTWSHILWWTAHMGNLQLKLLASDDIPAAFLWENEYSLRFNFLTCLCTVLVCMGLSSLVKLVQTWSHALWWTAHMGNLQLKLLASDDIPAAFLWENEYSLRFNFLTCLCTSVGVHGIVMTGKTCANLESYFVMNSTHG